MWNACWAPQRTSSKPCACASSNVHWRESATGGEEPEARVQERGGEGGKERMVEEG